MAKGLRSQLAEIQASEAKIRREEERLNARIEEVIAPTRGKLQGISNERIDAFVRSNILRLDEISLDKAVLAEGIDRLLDRVLFGKANAVLLGDETLATPVAPAATVADEKTKFGANLRTEEGDEGLITATNVDGGSDE